MRMRPSGLLVGLLIATMIATVGLLGLLADLVSQRATRAADYRAGERGLHALVLPPTVVDGTDVATNSVRAACRPAPDTRCLHTSVLPNAVDPILKQLIVVVADDCTRWTKGMACRARGRIAGQSAVAVVFPHLCLSKSGRLPFGAVPGPASHSYYRGSDIVLELTKS